MTSATEAPAVVPAAKRLNLFQIVDKYQQDLERLADMDMSPEVVSDTVEGMQGDVEDKLRAVVAFSRQLDADAAARRAEAKRMSDGARAMENKAESLRAYAQIALQRSGLRLPLRLPEFTLNIAKLPDNMVVKDPSQLPAELRSVRVSFSVSALAFKDAEATPEQMVRDALGGWLAEHAEPGAALTVDHAEVVFNRDEILGRLKASVEVPGAQLLPVSYRLSVR